MVDSATHYQRAAGVERGMSYKSASSVSVPKSVGEMKRERYLTEKG
jgi:hypothetical protein